MSMETTLRNSNAALRATSQESAEQEVTHSQIRRIDANSDQNQVAAHQKHAVTLRPRPILWLRKLLVCGWSGYLLISPWPSSMKLDYCLLSVIILGTFRTVTIWSEDVTWDYRIAFIPFYTSRLSLKEQVGILTGWEERSGLGEALLLGLWGVCLAPLADWLCPWRGGPYRLWLKDSQGKQTLIWRGRVEKSFHRNHKLLGVATGLPSLRAPASESQPNWL